MIEYPCANVAIRREGKRHIPTWGGGTLCNGCAQTEMLGWPALYELQVCLRCRARIEAEVDYARSVRRLRLVKLGPVS